MAQFKAVVSAELRRFIKRNSSVGDYVTAADDFYLNLRRRGYPPDFLSACFSAAPSWLDRAMLLTRSGQHSERRIHVLKLTYSTELAKLPWGEALHRHEHLLPDSIRSHTRLVCWKAAPKLGRSFIPYRYGATPAASGGALVPSVVDRLPESGFDG